MTAKRFVILSSVVFAILCYSSCSIFKSKSHQPFPVPPSPKPYSVPGTDDADNDGIIDSNDKCPNVPGVAKYNGCPIPDTDGDGINDEEDQCPKSPGRRTNNGCPEQGVGSPPPPPNNEDLDSIVVSNSGGSAISRHHEFEATSAGPEEEDTKPGNATLGFSYYKIMPLEETRDLRVTVIINGTSLQVRRQIRNIENEELEFVQKNDTSTICIVGDITAYKKLKITLLYDKSDFTITPVETEDEQVLDFVKGNNWHWKVRAVAEKPRTANITMLINAETPDGQKFKIATKQVDIKIVISQPVSIWIKIGNWFGSHIEYLLSTLVIPLVVYFYGRRRKRLDEAGKKTANNTDI